MKINFTGSDLESIPEKERIIFVKITNVFNEFNILQKIILISIPKAIDFIENKGRLVQLQFFNKILVGKLYECWLMVKRDFIDEELLKTYETILSEKSKDCLQNLMIYFGFEDSEIMRTIRNKYAFHYDRDTTIRQIQNIPSNLRLEMFIAEEYVNCLFSFSEGLIIYDIFEQIDPLNLEEAAKKFIQISIDLTEWFQTFFQGFITIIGKKYFSKRIEIIEVDDPPNLENLEFPYFIKRPN